MGRPERSRQQPRRAGVDRDRLAAAGKADDEEEDEEGEEEGEAEGEADVVCKSVALTKKPRVSLVNKPSCSAQPGAALGSGAGSSKADAAEGDTRVDYRPHASLTKFAALFDDLAALQQVTAPLMTA